MTKRILLIHLIVVCAMNIHAQKKTDTLQTDTLFTQTIIYKTEKAGHVYLLWAVNNWQKPEAKYIPENSFIQKEMAWTKMEKINGEFSLSLTLPAKTYLNFMFWVPIDPKGDSTDGWDTYGNIFYSANFTENKKVEIKDSLGFTDKKKPFDILGSAKYFLLIVFLACALLVFFYRKNLSFRSTGFFAGLLLSSVVLIALIRMQMNNLFNKHAGNLFGAVFHDLLWLAIISLVFYALFYLARKNKWLTVSLGILSGIVLVLFCLTSIMNIQIVKQLGRPLNYQWLYYSDFMQGADAKNAIAYNVSTNMITNICLLLFSTLIAGIAFSLLPYKALKKINIALAICISIILITGYIEKRTIKYEEKNIINPAIELITSAFTANQKPRLFSMDIPDSTKKYIEGYHSVIDNTIPDSATGINNIILFVMESTPWNVIGLYDSSISVTPNMKKWKNISTIYNNMYAHIPSTPNSMLSMVAGIYPQLSYVSMIKEGGTDKLTTLPKELQKKDWTTSFFSSADLSFGNMDAFAKESGFQSIEDSRTITCEFKSFQTSNTSLDGLNDKCIARKYLEWADNNITRNKFCMLWTNQTHYPYYFDRDKEINYVSNRELNHYLNALKSSDEAFGELMTGLDKRGMLRNTLVIVVGDHGEAFGTHNQYSHASHIYEENMHIPCIMYNPLLCNGNIENKITGMIDVAPTIASIAGIKKPDQWQGKSLFNADNSNRAFFICPYSDFLFGTRTGTWKYIYNATRNQDELYDLQKDPKELKNIASRHRDIVKTEYEKLGAWIQYHNAKMVEWSKLTGK